ncbi:hypothetical protein A9Q84_18100 [Halobacteriovorax marinus]|uniref:Response regulatory domain-containing protein n=1 Tax=Halobacteriovorax marinus TaxID=97084 RepID=A0A1Y5F3G6_9BACT|nr:hypothetical protein A9Q84_18100 [Halobacteriovorax marinus]
MNNNHLLEILIVEDNLSIRELINAILNKNNFRTNYADNGSTALSILKEKDIDLVISDINMPVMGGIELLDCIKDNFSNPHPVIFVSGDPNYEELALKKGAIKFYTKPFPITELLTFIESHFEEKLLV